MNIDLNKLESKMVSLELSIPLGNNNTSMSLWSSLIKYRDGYKCLRCGSKKQLESHHIFRKCFIVEAMFDSGNGITLCRMCHREMHKIFNRRPASVNFMNAEGGDDADFITENLFLLIRRAKERGIPLVRYYNFGEEILKKSEYFQGVELGRVPNGSPIERMFYIWRQCPPKVFGSVMNANGLSLESPFDEGITIKLQDDGIYVTVVEVGDFAIESRGSYTMVFEPRRDPDSIVQEIEKIFGRQKVTVKDTRTRSRSLKDSS